MQRRLIPCLLICLLSCCDLRGQNPQQTARWTIRLLHCVDNVPAVYDTLAYSNASGNRYAVCRIQYFISRITLHARGTEVPAGEPQHYADSGLSPTLLWQTDVPAGRYDSLSFTFGLSPELNQSYIFRNPPENLMFWPEALGGGYHCMKLDLKYINRNGQIAHFNCHLGNGQEKNPDGQVTGRVGNHFRVTLPLQLTAEAGKTAETRLVMRIEKWFDAVHRIDFNRFERGIMDNLDAMRLFRENGRQVFDILTL
ncbi:MAG: hypothetical protein LBF89_04985 [Bacteroidales bacterium]|jgi:hypothetical protein|nr:hypothetical protein [Bacteroidales bacterium]